MLDAAWPGGAETKAGGVVPPVAEMGRRFYSESAGGKRFIKRQDVARKESEALRMTDAQNAETKRQSIAYIEGFWAGKRWVGKPGLYRSCSSASASKFTF